MKTKAQNLRNSFENQYKLPKPQLVANTIYTSLTKFEKYLPIMKALCNKGLKPRHHKKMREILHDDNIQFDETSKFTEFIDLE